MGKRITVTIEGYGEISVKRPKTLTDKTLTATVARAVSETMNLVSSETQSERFHPVLGIGGYRG